ncbi:MAG: GNAT family N-acetyltransferase [Candidatus Obscuribacterales bacterium]|nr:GNAT family N-acetyltransferase [Candidatus Obscuribacterales bacterium]
MIREYKDSDFEALHRCFCLLQDYERDFEPLRLPADQMADAYLKNIFEKIERYKGKIFIAVADDVEPEEIAGYISLLGRMEFDSDLNYTAWIAYVTDLIVLPEHRKGGTGQKLIKAAEDYAREQGSSALFLNVLAENKLARTFYEKEGFKEYDLRLRKEL